MLLHDPGEKSHDPQINKCGISVYKTKTHILYIHKHAYCMYIYMHMHIYYIDINMWGGCQLEDPYGMDSRKDCSKVLEYKI